MKGSRCVGKPKRDMALASLALLLTLELLPEQPVTATRNLAMARAAWIVHSSAPMTDDLGKDACNPGTHSVPLIHSRNRQIIESITCMTAACQVHGKRMAHAWLMQCNRMAKT